MRTLTVRFLPLAIILLVAACSSPRPLPKYQTPITRAAVQSVRTTAYTHTESDHVAYGAKSALGTTLQCGPIHSAAADWSRWPAGTIFRIRETGEIFRVDDYGWALAGTNTIDLYRPSRAAMNAWGVRRVTIENLQWGDPRASLAVLRPRSGYRHIRRMIDQLVDRMPEWSGPQPVVGVESTPMLASAGPVGSPVPPPVASMAQPAPVRVARAIPVADSTQTARAIPVAPPAAGSRSGAARDPFFANANAGVAR